MILTETIIAEIAAVIDIKERQSNNYKRKRHKNHTTVKTSTYY